MRGSKWFVVGIGFVSAFAISVALRAEPRNNVEPDNRTASANKVAKPDSVDEKADKEENNPKFHADLLKLAAEYRKFGRVDDDVHWAPTFCRAPFHAKLRFSKSDAEATHGQKLYYLYAKDRSAYLGISEAKAKPGQAIIKESWHAEPIAADAPKPHPLKDPRTAKKDGKLYGAGKQGPLFIMYRTDADTPETDEGWVYGTLSTDGKTVTSAGRVASCMACHQDAPHGRLFGLQAD